MKSIILLFLILLYNLLSMIKSLEYSYYSYSNNRKYSDYFIYSQSFYKFSNHFNSNKLSYDNSNHFNSNKLSYDNSNYFNSNKLSYDNSNYFNSKHIIHSKQTYSQLNLLSRLHVSFGYISIIKTMPSQSISVYKYSNSYNSFNEYLSIIKTMPSQSISKKYSSLSITTLITTFVPTLNPTTLITTFVPTLNPTTLITTFVPTLNPTTLITTFVPTLKPSKTPTILETPVIVFDTKLSFNNYDSLELDNKSQQVIIVATANSMNISASYIEYIGSSLKTRRQLYMFRILGFNIIVTLKTTIPIQGNTDPKILYSTLTTNLINSVNSGLFTTYLITSSNALGVISFANSTILSVKNDDYIIKEPDKPYINENENENETLIDYNTIYIIFGVLLLVYLILYFVWLRKKYNNKIRRLRSLFENMINTDDITIRIVEN